jgi:hypothetical protein
MQDAGAAGAKRPLSGDLEVSVPKLSKVELSDEVLQALKPQSLLLLRSASTLSALS